jgi:hypothetical protein
VTTTPARGDFTTPLRYPHHEILPAGAALIPLRLWSPNTDGN